MRTCCITRQNGSHKLSPQLAHALLLSMNVLSIISKPTVSSIANSSGFETGETAGSIAFGAGARLKSVLFYIRNEVVTRATNGGVRGYMSSAV